MDRQMIICSEEELYVLRLADVIADREELDLQVQVCTSFEQAEKMCIRDSPGCQWIPDFLLRTLQRGRGNGKYGTETDRKS